VTRDRQRGRLYAWEDAVVAPRDTSLVSFAQAQGMIDAIWSDLGLYWPPRVERLPRQSRRLVADANRLRIRLPERIASWCVLHELAHALTSTHDGATEGHGPCFVGIYLRLLVRYMRLPPGELLESLQAAGIAVDADAQPVFVSRPAAHP
jgi:hypothetical protein